MNEFFKLFQALLLTCKTTDRIFFFVAMAQNKQNTQNEI